MSNPKHVQLKPEDAAKIVEVLADVETTAPRYFKKTRFVFAVDAAEERSPPRSRSVRKGG